MTNSITNRQLFFILFLTLATFSSMNIANTMVQAADTGSWIPILITALIFAVAVTVIVSLHNLFQGKVLFDYGREIVGKFAAYVLAFYFIVYFIALSVYFNVQMANLLHAEFYPRTPQWATLLLGIPVFGLIAHKGITNVARLFEIYGIIFVVTAVSVHAVMFTQGMSYSIFPLFNKEDTGKYIAAIKDAIFPFIGIGVLTVIPFTQKNGKKATKTAFVTVIAIGLFLVLVVESCLKIVGYHNIVNYEYSLIEAIKILDAPLVERFDILYLTIGFFGLIAGITVFYLAVVEYACRVFPKIKRAAVVAIAGTVIYVLSLLALNLRDANSFFVNLLIPLGLVSTIVIPAVLYVTARVKKHAGKIR